jgi:hypothetical protein
MSIIKAELPNFVQVTGLMKGVEIDKYIEFKVRINPYHINSYHEATAGTKNIVVFNVSGLSYLVNMTIEEADKMMQEIDRSLSFNE